MNTQNPLISIIVPMHNVGKYIERCVESILNQSYDNFELILIDDHSIDNTVSICEKLNSERRLVLKSNEGKSGVSAARNYGMELAKGDYITFVDADDVIAKGYLESLYRLSQAFPDRLAMCKLVEFDNNPPVFTWCDHPKKISMKRFLTNVYALHPSACACLFQAGLIREYGIRFDEDCSFCEDDYFTSKYVALCNGVALIPSKLYGYYVNYNGLGTHKDHSKLNVNDVNHRAESLVGLNDALVFSNTYNPQASKYIEIGYCFIAADVILTSERAKAFDYKYKNEISGFLSLKNCIRFSFFGHSIKQKLLVNGIAINAHITTKALDKIYMKH